MYAANSSILYSLKKLADTGHLTSMLSECFWPPLFQTNWISRRTNKSSEKLTSLSIFSLNIKQFLWKYHILPTLFWTALVLLRSKQRKCYRWKVYSPISPDLNGAFCDCFATCQLAQTFILKLKCSAFIRNTSRPEKGASKIEVFVLSGWILGNILYFSYEHTVRHNLWGGPMWQWYWRFSMW